MTNTQRAIAVLGALILIVSLIVLIVASLPAEREQLVDPIKPGDLASPTPEAGRIDRWRGLALWVGDLPGG